MHFTTRQKVLFRHCDPAGIVFYPRYFEMLNDAVEAFFAEGLGWAFVDMHPDNAAPTVSLSAEFQAPSRHGDLLDFALEITRLGHSSMTLRSVVRSSDEIRFTAEHTMVCVDGGLRPSAWPDRLRHQVQALMEGTK